jgi:hypothetical protein
MEQEVEKVEDVFCSPFGVAILLALAPIELGILEASCSDLKKALSSTAASKIWVASCCAKARRNRLLLSYDVLATMPIPELKAFFGKIHLARGLLNCGPVSLYEDIELQAVSSVCSQLGSKARSGTTRVIVGRFYFDEEELMAAAAEGEREQEEAHDDFYCYSSEVDFWWPGCRGSGGGATFSATMGCRNGANTLDLCSVIKSLQQSVCLNVDMHLACPSWPGVLTKEGIEVCVDGRCPSFTLLGLDITDEDTQKKLTSPSGVLCVLVVYHSTRKPSPQRLAFDSRVPREAQFVLPVASASSITTVSSINALALTLPRAW